MKRTDGTVGVRMSSNRLHVILWLTCWCPVLPVHVSADARVQVLTADPTGKKQTLSLLFWARATGCPGSTGLQADPSPDPERRQTTSGTSASMTCSPPPQKHNIKKDNSDQCFVKLSILMITGVMSKLISNFSWSTFLLDLKNKHYKVSWICFHKFRKWGERLWFSENAEVESSSNEPCNNTSDRGRVTSV